MTPSMRVSECMTSEVITVTSSMQIRDAVQVLLEHNISGAPVLDDAGHLVGILTERDCLEVAIDAGYFDEPGGRVERYMTKTVETIEPHVNLMDIAVRFRDTHFRRFPVMLEGVMVGIISREDILRVLQEGAWFGTPT